MTSATFKAVISEVGYARGRLFTRNPQSGTPRVSAEIHLEEVRQTPPAGALPFFSLKKAFPEASQLLEDHCLRQEEQRKDALQVDFEISGGELRCATPEPLERSPQAAVAIACSMVREGKISQTEALLKVDPDEIRRLLLPTFSESEVRQALRQGRLLTQGRQGWGGAVSGIVVFDASSAWELLKKGEAALLLCDKLTYRQRDALAAVSGIIVSTGSVLAAQGFERPCVVASDLKMVEGGAQISGKELKQGDIISLDGGSGQVFSGDLRVLRGRLTDDALTLLAWADEAKQISLRANVSSVEDVQVALSFAAEGVGLCRIECLFQDDERLPTFQVALKDICLGASEEFETVRRLAQEIEEEAFALFEACQQFAERRSITVRLFDAPLSAMLRHWRDHTDLPADYFVEPMASWLEELNPMQGLRCGRLSLMFPTLLRLQVRVLLRAWQRATREGTSLKLQIMMPGVTDVEELRVLRRCVEHVAQKEGLNQPETGSMLELPRACLTADLLCEAADFLSFGTGDLTESTCGLSRYDSHLSFLPAYLAQGIFGRDPFSSIDENGVGALMKLATHSVKAKYPAVELGTCGAQAIDAKSLEFCCRIGLSYISVPPHHLPVARLAAARAALGNA